MSDKVAHYLQQHIFGEVMTEKDALEYFSTDGGVFKIMPQMIVYPRNANDVRKVARFTWQLAERGHTLPITARGKGTDQGGAALGSGIMMTYPSHMNKIISITNDTVVVEPGLIYSALQQALVTHGKFIPPAPSSAAFSTMGGAVANNAGGKYSLKYGKVIDYVKSVQAVLANGEIIETKRLTKRELNKKKGLTSFEGEVYRTVDNLIEDNKELIAQFRKLGVSKNSAGYNLSLIKDKDGSFDLTPLLVGSQGTLALITQITFKTVPHPTQSTLIAAYFNDIKKATTAARLLKENSDPAALEMVDDNLLNFVNQHQPFMLKEMFDGQIPKIVLLAEYDDINERARKRHIKKAGKIIGDYAQEVKITSDDFEKEQLWKLRDSAAAVIWQTKGRAKALPIIEDGVVPLDQFETYIEKVYELFDKYKLAVALWGHAGDANLHMQPFLDLSKIGDSQKVFKVANEYYEMVLALGGSTSGEHNDGRIRAPYLPRVFGPEMYDLFKKVKKAFDPHGTLNPGVKIDVAQRDLPGILRTEYSMKHLFDHMPRT